jgi:hypothetical protein
VYVGCYCVSRKHVRRSVPGAERPGGFWLNFQDLEEERWEVNFAKASRREVG